MLTWLLTTWLGHATIGTLAVAGLALGVLLVVIERGIIRSAGFGIIAVSGIVLAYNFGSEQTAVAMTAKFDAEITAERNRQAVQGAEALAGLQAKSDSDDAEITAANQKANDFAAELAKRPVGKTCETLGADDAEAINGKF